MVEDTFNTIVHGQPADAQPAPVPVPRTGPVEAGMGPRRDVPIPEMTLEDIGGLDINGNATFATDSMFYIGQAEFVVRDSDWKLCVCPGSGAHGRFGNEPASEGCMPCNGR